MIVPNGALFNVVEYVEGAEFKLYVVNGTERTLVETITTDANGVGTITTNLVEGTNYQLIETMAPLGYVLDSTPMNFTTKDFSTSTGFDGTIRFSVSNEKTTGQIRITKYSDLFGFRLAGATFELRSGTPDGELVASGTTGVYGILNFYGLNPDPNMVYYLVETAPPFGFDPLPEPIMITGLTETNNIVDEVVYNYETPATLPILKLDRVTEIPVAGVTFTLSNLTDTSIPDKPFTTDAEGKVNITGLLPGHRYQLTETSVPTGYALDNTNTYTFQVRGIYDELFGVIEYLTKNGNPTTDYEKGILNVYNVTTTDVTATKVWVDQPTGVPTPTIYFKLYQQVEGTERIEVAGLHLIELLDGT